MLIQISKGNPPFPQERVLYKKEENYGDSFVETNYDRFCVT